MAIVKIEDSIHKNLKEYCKTNGIKMQWFISRAVEKELKFALHEDQLNVKEVLA